MEAMSPQERLKQIMATDGYIDIPRDGPPGLAPPRQPAANGKAPKRKEATGRFQVLNTFVDESARLVSTTAQAVWMVLYRETKPNGLAQVSHNQIAEMIGLKRRATINATQELIAKGLIKVIHRGSATTHEATIYRIQATIKGGKS
jgi:hypothetical protein